MSCTLSYIIYIYIRTFYDSVNCTLGSMHMDTQYELVVLYIYIYIFSVGLVIYMLFQKHHSHHASPAGWITPMSCTLVYDLHIYTYIL